MGHVAPKCGVEIFIINKALGSVSSIKAGKELCRQLWRKTSCRSEEIILV